MKKFLLLASAAFYSIITSAQVICYVEAPSPNEGNYGFTYAEPGNWGVADLTDPNNAVSGEMVFVDDGTAGDSLACNALTNGADVNGKVAVLYRGSCEFGTKALNAENAGAIAVIIINNLSGSPVAMGAGADGLAVTVPVIMIAAPDGALLRDEIIAGGSTVFIGSKNGLYGDDLGMTPADVLRAKRFSNVQMLSQDASEFEVELGAWVRNYGSNDQTGVTLSCTIDLGTNNVYDETSTTPVDIVSGDSVYIPLPTFSQSSYANGYYSGMYTINYGGTEESDYDNTQEMNFAMSDSIFSMARVDETNTQPINTTNQFNGATGSLTNCIAFSDPNASRMGVRGVTMSAGTSQNPTPTSIDGEYVEVYVYEWNDVFTDINDPAFNISLLNEVGAVGGTEYIYTSNAQNENVFIPLEEPFVMIDDQRYLFCSTVYGSTIYPGYDTDIDYTWNVETYLQAIAPINIDGTWYGLGYGEDQSPAMSVNFFDGNSVGIFETPIQELAAFPNPASAVLNVPIGAKEGEILLTITDINGKVVSSQSVETEGPMMVVDVTTIPSGVYVMSMQYTNGNTQSINVVVNR